MAHRIVIYGWGNSTHVGKWVRGLSERGFEVKLIGFGGRPLDNVDCELYPLRGSFAYLTHLGRARRSALSFKPHLIHAHYAAGYGLWADWTPVRPRIVSVWGSDVTEFPSNFLKEALLRGILSRADWATATSELLRSTAVALSPEVANRISVIPFGVSIPDEIVPEKSDGPVRLCYLKMLEPTYGPDVLLKALAQARETIPELTLSIAGTGSMRLQLEKLAAQLRIQKAVEFVGWIEPADVYRFIRAHHLMLMPSRSEGFGVAVLEAAACGRATIASRVGGVPELINHGQDGWLVPPDDPGALSTAIVTLATDAALRRRLADAAYQRVSSDFRWENCLDSMTELYERLIYEQGKNPAV